MSIKLRISVRLDNMARRLRMGARPGQWQRAGNGDWVYVQNDVRLARVANLKGQWVAALEGPFAAAGDVGPLPCDDEAEGKWMIEKWRRKALERDGRVAALIVGESLR